MTESYRLTATAAVDLLRKREVSPLELIDAAAARIAETEQRVLTGYVTAGILTVHEARARLGLPRTSACMLNQHQPTPT